MIEKPTLAIVGPTAIGKTSVAIREPNESISVGEDADFVENTMVEIVHPTFLLDEVYDDYKNHDQDDYGTENKIVRIVHPASLLEGF